MNLRQKYVKVTLFPDNGSPGGPNLGYLYKAYHLLDARDRQDAIWYMAKVTLAIIVREVAMDGYYELVHLPESLFGIRIEIDDTMSYGEVILLAENEQERAIRRVTDTGGCVQVVGFPLMDLSLAASPPDPTFRDWLKAVLKRGKKLLRTS